MKFSILENIYKNIIIIIIIINIPIKTNQNGQNVLYITKLNQHWNHKILNDSKSATPEIKSIIQEKLLLQTELSISIFLH